MLKDKIAIIEKRDEEIRALRLGNAGWIEVNKELDRGYDEMEGCTRIIDSAKRTKCRQDVKFRTMRALKGVIRGYRNALEGR